MYLNGQLITDVALCREVDIETQKKGIERTKQGWLCARCATTAPEHFYRYKSPYHDNTVVYCRHCIQMGRIDNLTTVFITKSLMKCTTGVYHLTFQLSEQQQFASDRIVQAVMNFESLLVHAVTGAGKTEMMFEAIARARRAAYNVAIVSPRLDVVIELSYRVQQSFESEAIDVLHQASKQQYDAHFVISTVHQLYRFKNHFHVIFVDEVDAFPLSMDTTLMSTIENAARTHKSLIYMTATPPKKLKAQFDNEHTITLPARFHQKPLVVPRFKYFKVRFSKVQLYLLNQMKHQQKQQRTTLIFFSDIQQMRKFFETYRHQIEQLHFVHSEDSARIKKVEALRQKAYSIMLTTTILERGFTMADLDVWVVDSHRFSATALIQIAGRVGGKMQSPGGDVCFFHEGRTTAMFTARREIKMMNRIARQRGWIDG
ncbi:DNA/RNA helicase [Staphylococcus schleiferi]|uniref:DEAD/DEAH box helicase family protein n=1 Tax=Staphylococcus schleiferi TaxID=1295 RepID=UPI001430796B|nr:DEAD/DEAH box helicase family protein [Staphylococcus schleiferi]NHA41618.1 DNA/RNA helicase [Staphylococcus schleiferi]